MAERLTREAIVAAAVEIADKEGLHGLSMRRIADALGVGTMSLYRHVADKDALLLAMTEFIGDEGAYPEPVPPEWTWRDRVRAAAEVDWVLYQNHPWVLFTFASPRLNSGECSVTALNWLVTGFLEIESDPVTATSMALSVWHLIAGAALPTAGAQVLSLRADGDTEPTSMVQLATGADSADRLPRPLRELVDRDISDLVDQRGLLFAGLEMLCDGFAAGTRPARGH